MNCVTNFRKFSEDGGKAEKTNKKRAVFSQIACKTGKNGV